MNAYQTQTIPELEKEIRDFENYYLLEAENLINGNENVDNLFDKIFHLTNDLKADLEKAFNLFTPPVVTTLQLIQLRGFQYITMIDSFYKISKQIDEKVNLKVKELMEKEN